MSATAVRITDLVVELVLDYVDEAQNRNGEVEVAFLLLTPPDDPMLVYDIALLHDQEVTSYAFDVSDDGLSETISEVAQRHNDARIGGVIHLHPHRGEQMVFHSSTDEQGIRPLIERLSARAPQPIPWSRPLEVDRDEQGRHVIPLDPHGRRTMVVETPGSGDHLEARLEGIDSVGLGHSIVCSRSGVGREPLVFRSFSTRTRWVATTSADGICRVLPQSRRIEYPVEIVDGQLDGLPQPRARTSAEIHKEVMRHVRRSWSATPVVAYGSPAMGWDRTDRYREAGATAAHIPNHTRAAMRRLVQVALRAIEELLTALDDGEQAS